MKQKLFVFHLDTTNYVGHQTFLIVSIRCPFRPPQLSWSSMCCWFNIEQSDRVSVSLHQPMVLWHRQSQRGAGSQRERWTDIEGLISPSQESLTWRVSGLYCWSTVIAFPSVSHMDREHSSPPEASASPPPLPQTAVGITGKTWISWGIVAHGRTGG